MCCEADTCESESERQGLTGGISGVFQHVCRAVCFYLQGFVL